MVDRDGVRTFYEVYGTGSPTFLLLPSWAIVHSRIWKAQIPFLARHGTVVTFDPRGNGRSDRPTDPAAYAEHEYAADAIAVLDATGTEAAIVLGLSLGAHRAVILAADHPGRVRGLVVIGPSVPIGQPDARRKAESIDFEEERDAYDGWARVNRHSWRRDYRGFLEFFMGQMLPEPHSTKQLQDMIEWGLDIGPDTLIATADAPDLDTDEFLALCRQIRCPSMVIVGNEDHITGLDRGVELARVLGGRLEILGGAGHIPQARQPVRVNLLLLDFARGLTPLRLEGAD
jgi:pimeloyl-ACP methyl ester carboxylesterase